MYIVYFADKLKRENTKKIPYYSNIEFQHSKNDYQDDKNTNQTLNINNVESYSQVVKKVKKDNITINNIGEIILSQIPNVSSQSAIAIINKFKTIKNLIRHLEQDDKCLDDIFIGVDKPRRLNKNCKTSIYKYLLQIDNELVIE
jgi:ERCC4-type nuclease